MALSMMAQTVLENKDRVKELKNTVSYVENFYKKLEKIEDDLKVLNDTDRENIDDHDGAVERVIRFLNEPGQFLPSFLNLIFEGASSAYLSSVWVNSMIFLVQNIKEKLVLDSFHEKAEIPRLRKKQSIENLIADLTSKVQTLKINTPTPAFNTNLDALLASEEAETTGGHKRRLYTEEEEEETPRKKRRVSSSDCDSSPTLPPAPKPVKKKKKRVSSDCDSPTLPPSPKKIKKKRKRLVYKRAFNSASDLLLCF